MRKIINSTFITLDGVVENPHLWPSLDDGGADVSYDLHLALLNDCDAVLMGRRTYETFAAAWPARSGDPYSDRINRLRKFAVSTTLHDPAWSNTTVIRGDLVDAIKRLKRQPGKNIVQYGLGAVSFALLQHGLLDEIRLWVHPLIRGHQGPPVPNFLSCPPMRFQLADSKALPNGIVVVRYLTGGATPAP